MKKHLIILFAILVLGGLLRFMWLDRVPHSINGDELHYILNAKAFVLTGQDMTKNVTPLDILAFRYPPDELVQAELMYFFNMITVGHFPFSLVGIALPSAFLSFLLIIVMYLIVKKLFNQQTALIAAFLTAINPWFIAEGRTTYEMVASAFFYMSALLVMLYAKGWRILLALPLLILAFYAYIATKIFFPFTVVLYSAFCYFVVNKKKYLKQYLILIGACALFVGFFLFQLSTNTSTSRMSEIITPTSQTITDEVNFLRKISMDSPILSLTENKITVYLGVLLNNFFEVFSLSYLFFKGDYFFSFGRHGLMYLLDPLFLFIGASVLFINKKRLFSFLILMCALTVTPQIVHSTDLMKTNFSPHTTVLIPFLIIFIAVGIWETFSWFKKTRILIFAGVIGLYIILLINFINLYFFMLPLQHNFYSFPNRLASLYASMAQTTNDITIYTPDPRGKFQEYLFYTDSYSKETAGKVTAALSNKRYTLGKVSFVSCNKELTTFNKKNVSLIHAECGMTINADTKSIVDLSDSGAVYKIVHDRLCQKTNLKPYVSGLTIDDFALEKMSTEKFCQTFITAI